MITRVSLQFERVRPNFGDELVTVPVAADFTDNHVSEIYGLINRGYLKTYRKDDERVLVYIGEVLSALEYDEQMSLI